MSELHINGTVRHILFGAWLTVLSVSFILAVHSFSLRCSYIIYEFAKIYLSTLQLMDIRMSSSFGFCEFIPTFFWWM